MPDSPAEEMEIAAERRAELLASDARDDAEAAALKYQGFLSMTDAALINVIADPFIMPGEDVDAVLQEATAEVLRRLDAANRERR